MAKNILKLFVFPLLITLIILSPVHAFAQQCSEWAAKVVSVQGTVQVKEAGKTEWRQVTLNETYQFGDIIRVQEQSRAAFLLCNQTILRLDEKTTITFSGLEKEQTFLLNLLNGASHFFSRIPRTLKVLTPFVNGNVEGTEFLARVDENRTVLTIFEGRVAAVNEFGSIMVASGQSAMARSGQAPQLITVVRPRDAVQWALYYPAVIDFRPDDFPGDNWQKTMRESIEYYRANDIRGAFSCLAEVPHEDVCDPRFFLYRAVLLLTVGQVNDAVHDIETVRGMDPSNIHVLALQSVIAVVQNRKDDALKYAAAAIEAAPDSSSAHIALSYAQQAHFDINGAVGSVREAVCLDSENALAWARLSELWLSVGELDQSLHAAQRAVDNNPDLARTQSVLGFAYLMQLKLKESREAFTRAIAFDTADPQPRLGLGLAAIREGKLEEGRRNIEIAAALDPNNALVRSYMGKAYYEEKRDRLAKREYKTAKELDPKDPTPWLYDAILKQSENRPVEALQDIQKSIELNNNRAVYRSRLLLDQDLAARSASLGRIYNYLGFEKLALVEGWKGVNYAPADFSSHRLLADSYASQPRHQVARTSELLQAQLLQPININPVQPQMAESRLSIYEGSGPSCLSHNEFNPLFNRNSVNLQASGVAGGNDTYGDEVTASGVYNRISMSAGQFFYKTDGFRENNDQEKEIYNLFMQATPHYRTSIQAEVRYNNTEYGDLPNRINPENYNNNVRQNDRVKTVRLGLHHSFAPGSDLVGNFTYGKGTYDVQAAEAGIYALTIEREEDAWMGELQYLFRAGRFRLISGGGYADVNGEEIIETTFFLFPGLPPLISSSTEHYDYHHPNLYAYTYTNFPRTMTWTLGVSTDFFDSTEVDRDQVNPKVGLIWEITPSTTFRAAAFRVLKRTLITSQTVEPTQVAGFNQFFDDANGTDAWRYGVGLDQKFSRSVFGGVELSKRDLKTPYSHVTSAGNVWERVKLKEELARLHLYWTPHPWLSFTGEYEYERLVHASGYPGYDSFTKAHTHRFPLGVNFFHPTGFLAGVKATYVDQEIDPIDGATNQPAPTLSDQFWVFDAFVGYRLPKRYGLITLEGKNLFDNGIKFQDTDPYNPRIYPEQVFLVKITINF